MHSSLRVVLKVDFMTPDYLHEGYLNLIRLGYLNVIHSILFNHQPHFLEVKTAEI